MEVQIKIYLAVETMVFKIAHVRLQEKCGKKEIHGKLKLSNWPKDAFIKKKKP